MFEARLVQGGLLKKVVDAVKDLVKDANIEVNEAGVTLQAMDTAHVCLVALLLRADGFEHYRCDRPLTLGVSVANLSKILKCAGNEDIVTLKANDQGDTLTLMFESPNQDRIADFEIKLMDIDTEHLGIPETEYTSTVRMPSPDYSRIVKDLGTIGDSITLTTTKEGVKFSTTGDVGIANVTVRHNAGGDKPEQQTLVEVVEGVTSSFAVKYLASFGKGAPLSPQVKVSLCKDLPVVVEFPIADMGYLRFYLAPKIDEDDEDMGGAGGAGAVDDY